MSKTSLIALQASPPHVVAYRKRALVALCRVVGNEPLVVTSRYEHPQVSNPPSGDVQKIRVIRTVRLEPFTTTVSLLNDFQPYLPITQIVITNQSTALSTVPGLTNVAFGYGLPIMVVLNEPRSTIDSFKERPERSLS